MGGDYYDRPVYSAPSSGGAASSGGAVNDVVGKVGSLNPGLDPKSYIVEDDRIESLNPNPIIFALDVTGSMGEWPKIIYDKMPMFYGQIKMRDYLTDPAVSFCAIGDVVSDKAPLQVTRFGQGKEIDELIAKMWLEGGGGGNHHESYDLAAYFYNHHVTYQNPEMSFFFVTGDEGFWPHPKSTDYQKFLGVKPVYPQTVDAVHEWKLLKLKHNVFHIKRRYYHANFREKIMTQWESALGKERVMMIEHPKACVDVILGAIALTSGVTDLEGYVGDMKERGQDEERIKEVVNALTPYSEALKSKRIKPVVWKSEKKPHHAHHEQSHSYYSESLKKLSNQLGKDIPPQLICPLTKSLMEHPVDTTEGHTFERKAIEEWLEHNSTNPITKEPLASKVLTANHKVKEEVKEIYDKYHKKI